VAGWVEQAGRGVQVVQRKGVVGRRLGIIRRKKGRDRGENVGGGRRLRGW